MRKKMFDDITVWIQAGIANLEWSTAQSFERQCEKGLVQLSLFTGA